MSEAILTKMLDLKNNKHDIRFRRLSGEKWSPKPYVRSALELAWSPIQVKHPGPIVNSTRALERLDSLHSSDRYLIRSLAMGLPLAKAALTDLSLRIALETQFDCALYTLFGSEAYELSLGGIIYINGKRKRRTMTIQPKTLADLFLIYNELNSKKEVHGYNNLVHKTGINPNKPSKPRRIGPKIAAINGDDNLRGNISIGTYYASVNTEKRGQVIEVSKTASSRKYITYCQTPGFTPWSRLKEIVLDNFKRLAEGGVERWSYPVESGKKTYICRSSIRNKLLTQTSKGGQDWTLKSCDTSVTGRSQLLTQESNYLSKKDRVKAAFLHRLAYPQWYTNLTAEERLPAAYGGLSCPDYLCTKDIWSQLTTNRKKLIEASRSETPETAFTAMRILNRATQATTEDNIKDIESRHAAALEAINLFNDTLSKDKGSDIEPIITYTYQQAKEYALEEYGKVTSKSEYSGYTSTLNSSKENTSATSNSIALGKTTKLVRKAIFAHFIRLDTFDNSYKHLPSIVAAANGTLKSEDVQPERDMRRARRRIERSKFAVQLPEPRTEPPPGEIPWQWLYGATHGREAHLYILLDDYTNKVKPPRSLSTKVFSEYLYGKREIRISADASNQRRSRRRDFYSAKLTGITVSEPVENVYGLSNADFYSKTISDKGYLSESRLREACFSDADYSNFTIPAFWDLKVY